MRNLIRFSCSRAVLSLCLATIKVSRHRASKLSFDSKMASFSQKSKCLVPGCNCTAQRHFCPGCSGLLLFQQCLVFRKDPNPTLWLPGLPTALTLSFSLCWKPLLRACRTWGITPRKKGSTDPLAYNL